jgi:Mn2+/Fe2+ NRAMP family transporter
MALAGFALPGLFAIVTTAGLAYELARAGENVSMADAALSAVPTALAFGVAFCDSGIAAGMLDALAGLVAVPVLCVRTAINLGQTLN